MKINLRPICILSVVFSSLFFYNTFAYDFSVEGETKIQIANPSFNTNPWNTAKITGVGEGNEFILMTNNESIVLPLSSPLYKISDYYRDRIVLKDGVWGVERMVAVKTFDGSEDWQLLKKQSYNNVKTIIFSLKTNENVKICDGFSTHFDMYTYISQKTNVYDGISFSKDGTEIHMRFMNVRNNKTDQELKDYLKSQLDNNFPVKLFYVSADPKFEPFPQDIQDKLNSMDKNEITGFTDFLAEGIKYSESFEFNEDVLIAKDSGNSVMNRFMSGINDCVIYNNSENLTFFINALRSVNDGLEVELKDNAGKVYKSKISYSENNFLSSKSSEILFLEGEDVKVRLLIDLSKVEVPEIDVENFDYDKTGFNISCNKMTNLILPKTITASIGETIDFNNTVIYQGNYKKLNVIVKDSSGNIVSDDGLFNVSKNEKIQVLLEGNSDFTEIEIIITNNVNIEQKTIMFLGDSLINQDYYTKYFLEMFDSDIIKPIGTRGQGGNLHEGRGGWSAYDYCHVETKYGFTNPFLLNGKFDFGHYISIAKQDKIDYIIINLGINDINLIGHNSNKEIVGYFDEIIKSIKSYDNDIKIILNTPIMPFGKIETEYAKEKRLEFINYIMEYYADGDLLLSNMYLKVNHYNDFKFVEPIIDEDNQDYSLVVKDTTHLNVFGYKAMAKATYNDISYLEVIK